ALHHFEKGITLKADFHVSSRYRGCSLLLMDRPQEALRFFEQLPEDALGTHTRHAGMAMSYAVLSHLAKASKTTAEKASAGIRQLESEMDGDAMGRVLGLLVLCHVCNRDPERAIVLLEEGIRRRLPMMIYSLTDPMLKPLHQEARFQQMYQQIIPAKTNAKPAVRKYKKALFSKKELTATRQQLSGLMQREQPYLDPNLSLRSLAAQLQLPPNHLSQLLNEGFDKNFAEYVNDFRLAAFKQLAADPANSHLTLLALAYESGFNSKTVFNTYFRKRMGMTPSAYLKNLKGSVDL
ncbi:MAG: helix-turn-helix domain-containing protein, partial [Bacteroidota bacterium]